MSAPTRSPAEGADARRSSASTNGAAVPVPGRLAWLRRSTVWMPTAFIATVVGLWELYARLADVPTYLLPPPSEIVARIIESWSLLWMHTLRTLSAIGIGYTAGAVLGGALAIVMAYSATVRNTLLPPIIASQAVPKIAIAPLLVLWLGFDIWPKVAVTALMVFFPVTITAIEGLRSVDPRLLDLLRSVNASERHIFAKVRLPYALPHVFSGLKIGITLAVVGAVVGEWVGADAGLGYLLIYANTRLDATLLFSALTVLVVVGVGLYLLVMVLERLALPWREQSSAR